MALHGTCYVVGERGPTGPVTEFDTHGRVDRRGDNDTLLKKSLGARECGEPVVQYSTVQELYYYRVQRI